jgi:hypothetical protein
VINGVVAAPVMVMMMLISANKRILKEFVVTGVRALVGWLATAVMAIAALRWVTAMNGSLVSASRYGHAGRKPRLNGTSDSPAHYQGATTRNR